MLRVLGACSVDFLGYMWVGVFSMCIKVWAFLGLDALPELQHLGLLLSGF